MRGLRPLLEYCLKSHANRNDTPEPEDAKPEAKGLWTRKWAQRGGRKVPGALWTGTWPAEGSDRPGWEDVHISALDFHNCA